MFLKFLQHSFSEVFLKFLFFKYRMYCGGLSTLSNWYRYFCHHQLKADIRRKWFDLRKKQIFFIHDNVYPHFSELTIVFLDKLEWFIFSHLSYFIYLIWHRVIFLFRHLKDFQGSRQFVNDLLVKQAVVKFFCECPRNFYGMGIERLVDRYEKCLNSDGDYIEKQIVSFDYIHMY